MTEIGRARQIWVPYNAKIADISEDDTDAHYLDLEAVLSETRKIIAIIVSAERMSGTGRFRVYSNEGERPSSMTDSIAWGTVTIKSGLQRLKYTQSVANDDWDVYCQGYVVEI